MVLHLHFLDDDFMIGRVVVIAIGFESRDSWTHIHSQAVEVGMLEPSQGEVGQTESGGGGGGLHQNLSHVDPPRTPQRRMPVMMKQMNRMRPLVVA